MLASVDRGAAPLRPGLSRRLSLAFFVISNAQSSRVQMAFYGGYGTMAIPAALFILSNLQVEEFRTDFSARHGVHKRAVLPHSESGIPGRPEAGR